MGRARASISLVEADDGEVQVEIRTAEPPGPMGAWGEEPVMPEEYLQNPRRVHFSWDTLPGSTKARYLSVEARAAPSGGGASGDIAFRWLDLWEGSPEREPIGRMAAQQEVRLVWVNEHVVTRLQVTDVMRTAWSQALEQTKHVSRAAWREEMAELAWRRSESYRPGRPRPRPYKPRNAEAPERPVPFFAGRSGELPKRGTLEIAGVQLSLGRRYPGYAPAYWATDKEVPDALSVSQQLRQAFPQTGLWPLLWGYGEEPDSYMEGPSNDPAAVDAVDLHALLASRWERIDQTGRAPFTEFPGLAEPSEPTGELPALSEDMLDPDSDGAYRLLLVPCNRPADSIFQLGGLASEIEPEEISAMLRSWEERYHAVPYLIAPRLVALTVAAPPTTGDQALNLAAEHVAFAHPTIDNADADPERLADQLINTHPNQDEAAYQPHRWPVSLDD